MLEFVRENDKDYCILDGIKMTDQDVIDKMITVIETTNEENELTNKHEKEKI